MKNRLWTVLVILLFVSCNMPANGTTLTPPPTLELATPISSSPTPTLVPIKTLLAIPSATFVPTATSGIAIASPMDQPVNCRYGPSVAYSVVGTLDKGRQAEIVGRSANSEWWYVKNPSNPSINCWLAAGVTNAIGDLQGLPVVEAPLAIVTRIDVEVIPVSMNVSCDSFPQYVTATAAIFSNGPTSLVWRWESSEGESYDKDPLLFLEGGSQSVLLYYRVNNARNFWLQVHILSPNDTTGRAYFKVTCV